MTRSIAISSNFEELGKGTQHEGFDCMARLKFLAFAGIAMLGGSTVYAQQMPASCNTDPAIVSFKLEKGLSQQYRAVVQVNNLGSNHWQSAPGLQRLLVTFRNARTGNPITKASICRRARMRADRWESTQRHLFPVPSILRQIRSLQNRWVAAPMSE